MRKNIKVVGNIYSLFNIFHSAIKLKNIQISSEFNIDFPGDWGFGIVAPTEFIEQDFVNLTCALSKLNGTKTVEWRKMDENGELEILKEGIGKIVWT